MTADHATAEVSFRSVVSAQEMRFDEVPDTRVEFRGRPAHDSVSGSERVNLPSPARSGVTYRDVRVDYRIESRLRTADTGG